MDKITQAALPFVPDKQPGLLEIALPQFNSSTALAATDGPPVGMGRRWAKW